MSGETAHHWACQFPCTCGRPCCSRDPETTDPAPVESVTVASSR